MGLVKLGILGGTFDPVHNGHLQIARAAYDALNLSQVLFVPAGDPPHKQGRPITEAKHRLRMLELALSCRPQFAVSTVDLDRPGPHYTVDTVALLRSSYELSNIGCYFIIGSDSLVELPTWHNPAGLLSLCKLAVIYRPGYLPDLAQLQQQLPDLPDRVVWVEMPAIPISATQIRTQLACGKTSLSAIPAPVQKYIQAHSLYR